LLRIGQHGIHHTSYIILAEYFELCCFKKAAIILRARGHRADVVSDSTELLSLMDYEQPNVLVIGGSLGVTIDGMHAPDLIWEIPKRYPGHEIQLIWSTSRDDNTNVPSYDWWLTEISSFLVHPCSEWQVVVSVEQLLYRTVLPPLTEKIPPPAT